MKQIYIPQSHDALFKQFLQNQDVAKQFMEIYLPDDVKSICDLNTLQLESGSFVEPDLKQRFNDILYSVNTKNDDEKSYIYCLIENQSKPDKLIAFRLMHYAIMAMANHLKQGHKTLPLVVPILFYCGKKPHPPNISLNWLALFKHTNMAKAIYSTPFKLIDTKQLDDDELKTHSKLGLLEYLFKHIHTRDMMNMVEDLRHFLLLNQLPKELLESLLIYSFYQGKIEQPQEFFNSLLKQPVKDGDKTMTSLAEYLEQRGEQRGVERGIFLGREEGIQLGERKGAQNTKISIAKNLLQNGVSIDLIQKSTGLSEEEIRLIKKS